ncbi:hypothetical protein D3P04_22700 [Paracoccus onubensis]|uniref:Uncharacterized protein n=2 Tax=Paracoccus onubensis TaxID=1675788 RepID=A0A418SLQ6_9RHOB|nr:hypothetical protein D3P04_22700 [Paracoccus onubensis]
MLVWGGAVLTLLGLVALFWCIVTVFRLRRAAPEPEEFRARMQRVVAVNTGALMLSAIGLMCVVLGIILG